MAMGGDGRRWVVMGGCGSTAHHATTARAKCVWTCIVIESYIMSKERENMAMSMLSKSTTTKRRSRYVKAHSR